MAETQIAKPETTLAGILSDLKVKKRFEEILGARAAGFMSSVLSLYNANQALQEADPRSILQSAVMAATLDLPVNSNLGFAFLIPYGGQCQFQIGYHGFIQLAIRTGRYKTITANEVYSDEIVTWNPYTGILESTPQENWKFRKARDFREIVGFHAYYKLLNGFEKALYMTNDELMDHGKRYSKSFDKPNGIWKINPHAMKLKTVIKLLLSKYGLLSIQMEKALEVDQAVIDTTGEPQYLDRPADEPVASKPKGAEKKIDENHFKLLMAKASKLGVEEFEINKKIKEKWGLEHKHDLTVEQLAELIRWMEPEPGK